MDKRKADSKVSSMVDDLVVTRGDEKVDLMAEKTVEIMVLH